MISGDEAKTLIEDLRRATTYAVSAATAVRILERVSDDIAVIIERIELANENSYYRSIYPSDSG